MKNIYKIIITLIGLVPTVTFAIPTTVNQSSGFISPRINTDYMKAQYFIASSTSSSSIFNGLVGVGTTSPIVPLDVLSSTGQALSVTGGVAGVSIAQFSRRAGVTADVFINASGGDPQLVFSRLGTSEFSIGDDTGVFKISGSAALGTNDILSATTGGNVGIGSSSPSSTLSVTGNMYQRGGYAHFGNADSRFTCRTFSVVCTELVGDDNTTGGVLSQIENINSGSSAYTGFTMLNDLAYLGNNASYYAGVFLNGSGYNDPTFGPLNNVPNILQVGNTMGPITLQASSTGSNPSYISFATGGIQTNNERVRINTFGLGVGTTTTRWPLQAVSTSTSQLVLSSDPTAQHFSIRTGNNGTYMSFINPVTFATSTNPAITLSPLLTQVAIGTSTTAAGVGLTVAGNSNPVSILMDSISSTGMYTIYRNSNIDMGYIGSAGVLFSGSAGVKTDFAVRGSTAVSLGVGSGEDMRIASTGFVGIGTTSPYARLAVVGQTVSEYFTATSTTATSTFAGGVDLRGATVQQKMALKFGIATSTAWAGTTTRQLGAITTLQTWNSATCYTTGGTLNVVFGDGTNSTNMIRASSTPATFALTANNRFVAGSKSQFSVGTPATSPTEISCTIDYISNI